MWSNVCSSYLRQAEVRILLKEALSKNIPLPLAPAPDLLYTVQGLVCQEGREGKWDIPRCTASGVRRPLRT